MGRTDKGLVREYDKRTKKGEYAAQKIRDYFNTPEWNKVKKKNGYF